MKLVILAYKAIILITILTHFNTLNAQHGMKEETHKITVEEAIQTTSYTYLRVLEDTSDYWMAIPKREVTVGEVYFYSGGMQMGQFTSKELSRTFDAIIFAGGIKGGPETNLSSHHAGVQKKEISSEPISVDKAEGGITIAELLGNKEQYANKEVIIRGQVVKVNTKILGHNWIHLQDGTKHGEENDLTLTTSDTVEVGNIVTFKGKIALNKSFGSGYNYAIIMEEAVVKEKQ